jgi:tetratricopeptide (TPR) repeat protein
MSDHLSAELLGRLFRLDTFDDAGVWEEAFFHLRTCPFCSRRARPWLKLLFRPAEVAATAGPAAAELTGQEAVERAFAALRKRRSQIDEERGLLTHALTADPPIDLSVEDAPISEWAEIMLHLHRSHQLRYSDPREMMWEAVHANCQATNLDEQIFGAAFTADLRARTAMELANAYRVNEAFNDAVLKIEEAQGCLARGTGDLMLQARLCDVVASYAIDTRRFADAHSAIDRAREIYEDLSECHLAGRALVSKGIFLDYDGQSQEALDIFRQALSLLDPKRDATLFASTQLSFLDASVRCGEYHEAGRLLVSSGLRQAFEGEPLNLFKLRWVEAKVHAGLGRLRSAEQALQEARKGFEEHSFRFRAALAGLDLAEIWLREGRLQEVTSLAEEVHQVFVDLKIGREAQRAARYFAQACKAGIVTANVIRYVADFLNRFERDRGVVFWVPSTLL